VIPSIALGEDLARTESSAIGKSIEVEDRLGAAYSGLAAGILKSIEVEDRLEAAYSRLAANILKSIEVEARLGGAILDIRTGYSYVERIASLSKVRL